MTYCVPYLVENLIFDRPSKVCMPSLLEIFGLMVRRTIGFSDYWSFGPMVRRNIGMSPCQPISSIRLFNIVLQGLSSPMGQVCQFWLNLLLKLRNNSLIDIWCTFVSSRYVFPQVVECTRHWSDVPAIRFLHLKWFYIHSTDVTTSRYVLMVRRNMKVGNRNVSSNIWLIHVTVVVEGQKWSELPVLTLLTFP